MSTSPDFAAAARRHFSDAEHLCAQQRLPNADHLAGLAAECGLKAILIDHCGGSIDAGGKPRHGTKCIAVHLPTLWAEVAALINGRSAGRLVTLLGRPNPFQDSNWDIQERYSAGSHIHRTRVREHLVCAKRILTLHEHGVTP